MSAVLQLCLACGSGGGRDAVAVGASGFGGKADAAGGGGSHAGGSSAGSSSAGGDTRFPTSFGEPEVLIANLTRPVRLAMKDDYLYFVEMGLPDGSSSRLARRSADGSVQTLFTGVTLTALYLDQNELFFVERGTQSLYRMSYTSLEPELVTTTANSVGDVVAVGDTLWLSEFSSDAQSTWLVRLPRAGGETLEVSARTGAGYIFSYLGVGGGRVYASTTSFKSGVAFGLFQVDAIGSQLSVPAVASNHLTADDRYVYFGSELDGRVLRLGHASTEPELIAEGENHPFALATDAAGIYWTDAPDCNKGDAVSGSVSATPLDGGSKVLVAEGQPCPLAIASGPDAIYWIANNPADTLGDDAILRARKQP